ncbi:MAG: hypothetical protein KR126chlam1_00471 [Chlamydiae bacterium]|nr:hypothetical protein [Chlamydiota bacterium]
MDRPFKPKWLPGRDLDRLDRIGFVPGPDEDREAFLERVDTLETFFSHPSSDVDYFLTDTDWSGALKKTETLYGFAPNWIVAHYSDRRLPFFQGAATWIVEREGVRVPLIQLRTRFDQGSYMKIYRREEVLAHEAVHAMRMQFDEPYFEEIFAYKTSSRFYRRFFGPIFMRPWESYIFILLLFSPIGVEVARFFVPELGLYAFFGFLPALFLGVLLIRLFLSQMILFFSLRYIKGFLQPSVKPLAAAVRLSDSEIFRFAFAKREKLKRFIRDKKSLRWTLLREKYFL